MKIIKYTHSTTSDRTAIIAVLTDRRLPVAKDGRPLEYISLVMARKKVKELNERLKQNK